jgi:hypothetical protein
MVCQQQRDGIRYAMHLTSFFASCRYQAFNVSTSDFADIRRCLLHNYLQAALTHEAAASTVALRSFLRSAQRKDWPDAVGPIDLKAHDLPHDSSATEWWYFNTHFEVCVCVRRGEGCRSVCPAAPHPPRLSYSPAARSVGRRRSPVLLVRRVLPRPKAY